MTLDAGAKTNGSDPRARMHSITRHDAEGDPASIRALCATIDRLTALVERLIEREVIRQEPAQPTVHDELTPRELEVSRLIVEGLSTSQIAARLVVEQSTVRAHRRSISRKCGTSSKQGLVAKREEWDQT